MSLFVNRDEVQLRDVSIWSSLDLKRTLRQEKCYALWKVSTGIIYLTKICYSFIDFIESA